MIERLDQPGAGNWIFSSKLSYIRAKWGGAFAGSEAFFLGLGTSDLNKDLGTRRCCNGSNT